MSKQTLQFAETASPTSQLPCTNVLLECPLCGREGPQIWRYNMKAHLEHVHETNALLYISNYIIFKTERMYMHFRWDKILKSPNKPHWSRPSKVQKKQFAISEAHSPQVVFE